MRFFFPWRRFCSLGFSLVAMLLLLYSVGCSGGSSGGGGDVASDVTGVFNKRNINLYEEVPAIGATNPTHDETVMQQPSTYPASTSVG